MMLAPANSSFLSKLFCWVDVREKIVAAFGNPTAALRAGQCAHQFRSSMTATTQITSRAKALHIAAHYDCNG